MGNLCAVFASQPSKKNQTKRLSNAPPISHSSNRWTRGRSSRKEKIDDAVIQEQALAAAILFKQHQQNGTLPFDRSSSFRYPNAGYKKNSLPRSSSSRARSLTDPLLQPHQLVNQVCFRGCGLNLLPPLTYEVKQSLCLRYLFVHFH